MSTWGRQAAALRLALALATALAWAAGARGAEDVSLEHRVKAAFLYKIAGYVDWPPAAFAQPDTPIAIGVVGAEPVAAELAQAVVGRTAQNRPVTVRRLRPGDALDGLHMLFIGRAESAQLAQLVPRAQQRSILVVSEADSALQQGAAINFVVVDGRVRFEIALPAVETSRLRLSSRLLAVARQVYTRVP